MIDPKQLMRPNIVALQPYSSARSEFSGTSKISLDANENPFGTMNRYPDPHQSELKKRLSEIKEVAPENIFIGNGSDEAIDLCFRIFCRPGRDKAAIFTPTYGMYKVAADINDVEIVELALDQDFQVDFDGFSKMDQSDLKLLFVCSPNNPTGNGLDRIDEIIAHFNGIVVLDEAYADFAQESSLLPRLCDFPNLIILQTLSKAWGLAGLRIGMAFAGAQIISVFNKVKPPYNIAKASQEFALAALDDLTGFQQRLQVLLKERETLIVELQNIRSVMQVFSSQANFVLVQFRNCAMVYDRLVCAGIVVRDRSSQIRETLRISIGTPHENQTLIDTLKSIQ